jgi:hypothetical protein
MELPQTPRPKHVRWLARAGAALALGAGLSVIGPYGTYDQLTLPLRLVYWISIIGLNGIQVAVLTGVLARLLRPHWPEVAVHGLAACAASLPATGEVLLLERWLRPGVREAAGVGVAEIYFLVLVITLPVTLVLAGRRQAPATGDERTAPPVATPAFLDRLPPKLHGALLCVRAEDHYLRVYTAKGDDLILMRLADAELELARSDGLRVHRSWWVARRAVVGVEKRGGGGLALVLVTGHRVPVSRSYLGAVHAAGWTGAASED